MKKEAITHGVLEDLANRNENWDKLDGVINQVNELDESRLILKNEIVNGDFSDGAAGWVNYGSGGTRSIADGKMTIKRTTEQASGGFGYQRNLMLTSEDKLYMSMYLDNKTNNVFTMQIAGSSNYVSVQISGLRRASTITTVTTSGIKQLILSAANVAIDVDIFETNLINLTQTFGAGNEPTKEEMDIIMDITGYFNGEYTITSKEQFNILLKMVRENALATTSLGGGF